MKWVSIAKIEYLIIFFTFISCTDSRLSKPPETDSAVLKAKAQQLVNNHLLSLKTVLSGKATMLIPDKFELMDAEMLAIKYPQSGHRPTEVYTNEDGTINIALNYTQNKADEKDLAGVKNTMESQFNQPTIEFIQSSMQEINGRKYIQLEFVTPAADSKIYNLLQIASLEGRLAMFTFNCTESYRKDWEATGKKIMQSIKMR